MEEEDAPASLQVTAHAEPLTLLAVFKLFYGMLVWLQLCTTQGVALFSFVRFAPRVLRPFAGAAVYGMSLHRRQRQITQVPPPLRVKCCPIVRN